eukprot:11127854-Heterocapsa_arctica.AAC.1
MFSTLISSLILAVVANHVDAAVHHHRLHRDHMNSLRKTGLLRCSVTRAPHEPALGSTRA